MNWDTLKRRYRKTLDSLGFVLVTSAGRDVAFAPASMRDNELRNRAESFREAYQRSVLVLADDCPVTRGETVTISGTEYRVLDIAETGDGLQKRLDLADKYGA